jgi:mono/diheme cytochrome c family protein
MRKPLSLGIVLFAVAVLVSSTWVKSAAQTGKGGAAGGGGDIAALYSKQCAKCHLETGKGLESLKPPDFTDAKWQASHTDAALAKGIRNGEGAMPAFKDTLSAAQITGLIKHIRGFKPKATKK